MLLQCAKGDFVEYDDDQIYMVTAVRTSPNAQYPQHIETFADLEQVQIGDDDEPCAAGSVQTNIGLGDLYPISDAWTLLMLALHQRRQRRKALEAQIESIAGEIESIELALGIINRRNPNLNI